MDAEAQADIVELVEDYRGSFTPHEDSVPTIIEGCGVVIGVLHDISRDRDEEDWSSVSERLREGIEIIDIGLRQLGERVDDRLTSFAEKQAAFAKELLARIEQSARR